MGSSCNVGSGLSDTMKTFLKETRKLYGYSQTHLAHLLEVANSTVCDWESGRTLPSRGARRNLARLFNIPMGELNALHNQAIQKRKEVISKSLTKNSKEE